MAGIGFELRKLMANDTYAGSLRAYGYAGIISSGPWIISILSIVVLTVLLRPWLMHNELDFFSASITHVYAFSLILVGPIQLVLTRYIADCFSEKSREKVFPSFVAAVSVTAVVSLLVGVVFFVFLVPGPLLHQLSAATLLVYVACTFVAANYLSALRNYKAVVASFAIGYAASGLLAYGFARLLGPRAAVYGFTVGHALLFVLLVYCLRREFGGSIAPSAAVLSYFKRFPSLVLCGLLYNLGIWADKLMFWWVSDGRVQISGWLFSSPQYDVAIYLSLLSIVPGMAVFFLRLETGFAERYRAFLDAIEGHQTLDAIVEARRELVADLQESFVQLLKVQGMVTLVLVVFSESIGDLVSIGAIQLGIFRVTLFGAFLLICFLSLLTVLFYFDDRKGALWCTAAFALTNAGLSLPTLMAGEAWYGFGFVLAAGIGMIVAAFRVNHRVANLESAIFRGQ